MPEAGATLPAPDAEERPTEMGSHTEVPDPVTNEHDPLVSARTHRLRAASGKLEDGGSVVRIVGRREKQLDRQSGSSELEAGGSRPTPGGDGDVPLLAAEELEQRCRPWHRSKATGSPLQLPGESSLKFLHEGLELDFGRRTASVPVPEPVDDPCIGDVRGSLPARRTERDLQQFGRDSAKALAVDVARVAQGAVDVEDRKRFVHEIWLTSGD